MAEALLANPRITQRELAEQFRCSPWWISQIMRSERFMARRAKRAAEVIDPILYATVKNQMEKVMLRALELLSEKLERPAQDISDNLVLRTL
ncbi:MAG TPA: hypothetical protein VN812_04920 [Candidatus Acidoferrales bacterium]|nr:hypothetical protein [Candidatus Acidoferrales bacterium]